VEQGSSHGSSCSGNCAWVGVINLRECLLGGQLCLLNGRDIKVRG
jgi:hypothetical protein